MEIKDFQYPENARHFHDAQEPHVIYRHYVISGS